MTAWRVACLLIFLAAAAPAPPNVDAAGNRMATFAVVTPPRSADGADPFAQHCTAERTADRRWCARMREDEGGTTWWLELSQGTAPARRFDVAGLNDEESAFAIWPHIIVEASGAVMVGVEARRATGYAGGGASATRLLLMRAEPGDGALRQVLAVPLRAHKDIRACFGPRDMRRRRNACSDLYEYTGTLSLDPGTRTGRPQFLFSARARSWPGRRTRDSDSTTDPPLRRADLRWAVDPACTYRRRIAFDPRQETYAPDRPLPECTDYLDF